MQWVEVVDHLRLAQWDLTDNQQSSEQKLPTKLAFKCQYCSDLNGTRSIPTVHPESYIDKTLSGGTCNRFSMKVL